MWWAAILKAFGTGMSAYGNYEAALQEAAIYEYNALIAEQAAADSKKKAAVEEKRLRRAGERVKGSQKAAAGASGATIESFEEVFVDTAKEIELDALSIRYAGEVESTHYLQKAGLERRKAEATKRKGFFQAHATLLGGAGDTMSSFK